MSTVERRNRQDIHEGKHNTQQGCHSPEHIPIPFGWEQATDGSKTAE